MSARLVPLAVTITTRDSRQNKEVQQHFVLETRHPRWELAKLFWHAFWHLKFS